MIDHLSIIIACRPCVWEVADVRCGCVLKSTSASKPEGEVVILPQNRSSTMGWKGMLSNPDQANSLDIDKGLRGTCQLLVDLADKGMLIASKRLETITPQFLGNCLSLCILSAKRQQGNQGGL